MALPAVAVTVGMVLLGLLLTKVLADDGLASEAGINRELASDRTRTLNSASHVFTLLAETPTIVALTAIAAVACRLVFRRWRESVFLVVCVTGETLIFLLTSFVIERKRPPVPHLDDAPPTSSFPSGHTAAAVCFYGALAAIVVWHSRHALLRVAAAGLAILIPLAVGASRMYRGMHFGTDVLAGLLLGVTWLTLCTRLVLTWQGSPAGRRQAAGHATADGRATSRREPGVTAPAPRRR
jgi:undecaprenyl-diphosphatase